MALMRSVLNCLPKISVLTTKPRIDAIRFLFVKARLGGKGDF